jgi:competence protein ComGC
MKKSMKGLALMEMIMVMTIITIITVAALSFFDKTKQALLRNEKMIVKETIFANVNPFSIHNISPKNIEKYVNEIIKENEGAVLAGKELPISEVNDYVNHYVKNIQNRVIPPVVKPVVVAPAPVIEQITENHYHFEALITAFKYIGFSILGIFTVFSSIKSFSLIKKYFHVRKATKESKKILDNFDNEFEENKNYLAFIRKISDQVLVNSVLIDNRKNKDTVLSLIVTNENLKDRLNFLENNFIRTMK